MTLQLSTAKRSHAHPLATLIFARAMFGFSAESRAPARVAEKTCVVIERKVDEDMEKMNSDTDDADSVFERASRISETHHSETFMKESVRV